MPQYDPQVLANVAAAIAMAAGLTSDSVSLVENEDGTFTIKIGDACFTGTFDEVCVWGDEWAARMREEAQQDVDSSYDHQ
jgi:hypothetical protein